MIFTRIKHETSYTTFSTFCGPCFIQPLHYHSWTPHYLQICYTHRGHTLFKDYIHTWHTSLQGDMQSMPRYVILRPQFISVDRPCLNYCYCYQFGDHRENKSSITCTTICTLYTTHTVDVQSKCTDGLTTSQCHAMVTRFSLVAYHR